MSTAKQQEDLKKRLSEQAIVAVKRPPDILDQVVRLITGQGGERFCLAVLVSVFAYLGGHIIYWFFWLR